MVDERGSAAGGLGVGADGPVPPPSASALSSPPAAGVLPTVTGPAEESLMRQLIDMGIPATTAAAAIEAEEVRVSHKTSCHPSPQKQIGTPAHLREPTRTPLLYSRPVTRSPRKTPEGAKRKEGGENGVIFLWGSRATGAPLSP